MEEKREHFKWMKKQNVADWEANMEESLGVQKIWEDYRLGKGKEDAGLGRGEPSDSSAGCYGPGSAPWAVVHRDCPLVTSQGAESAGLSLMPHPVGDESFREESCPWLQS